MAKGRLKPIKRQKKAQQVFKPEVRLNPDRIRDTRNVQGPTDLRNPMIPAAVPPRPKPLDNNRGPMREDSSANQRQTPTMPTIPKRKRTTRARLQ